MNMKTRIKDILKYYGLEVSDHQADQFITFYELMTEKNKVMNLTSITDFDDVLVKHFADSLSIVKLFGNTIPAFTNGTDIIDIGTGAGFPGVPLKIMFPQSRFVLADSPNKRIKFLNEAAEKCGLSGIEAVHGRAEDLGRNNTYREQFDICVSRAVANLSSLSEYCLPFVKPGGYFIAYKSGNSDEEIQKAERAVKILGGNISVSDTFLLPESDIKRTFAVIKKIKKTPSAYPRKAGIPGKMPL